MSDNFKEDAIQRYMSNHHLFISLFQNNQNLTEKELLSLLKSNHDMSRSILIDMGVVFHETDTIRSLNQRVREMEENQNTSDINFERVSTFINNQTNKLKKDLNNEGLHGSVSISMSPNLKVDIKLYASGRSFISPSSYRKEEDYLAAKEREATRVRNFKENFEIILDDEGDYLLGYTQTNLAIIKNILEKSLGESIDQLEYVIKYTYNDDNQDRTPYLSEIYTTTWTLQSSRSLSDVMKNR